MVAYSYVEVLPEPENGVGRKYSTYAFFIINNLTLSLGCGRREFGKMLKRLKTWQIILSIFGFVTCPVILNFVLSCYNPIPQMSVVGKGEHWLSFFGAYIGSGSTILVSLYILMKEIDFNQKENRRERKQQSFLIIKKEIIGLVSNLQLPRVINQDVLNCHFWKSNEMTRLSQLLTQSNVDYNIVALAYRDKASSDFFIAYQTCSLTYQRLIESAMSVIYDMKPNNYGLVFDNINNECQIKEYKRLAEEVKNADSCYQELAIRTQNYLDNIESQIEK